MGNVRKFHQKQRKNNFNRSGEYKIPGWNSYNDCTKCKKSVLIQETDQNTVNFGENCYIYGVNEYIYCKKLKKTLNSSFGMKCQRRGKNGKN